MEEQVYQMPRIGDMDLSGVDDDEEDYEDWSPPRESYFRLGVTCGSLFAGIVPGLPDS